MPDIRYWVGFNIVQGIGPVRVKSLVDRFGDLAAAWNAAPLELAKAGLDGRAIESLVRARQALDLDGIMARIDRSEVRVLTWEDPGYPPRLREIPASPPVLYLRGEFCPEDEWAVAVVGTRSPTSTGKEITRQIVGDLARSGVTIVSGLARGIDAQAHQAALEAGGRTLAVLGSGVDVIYPPEHKALAERICRQGAIMSDYPLGTRPDARNFPPRNRIVSGLSLGVLVVEGGARSGARLTAQDGLEQDREVFAVPGNILSRNSELPNRLIQDGAKAVTCANDILEELNLTQIACHAEARATLPEQSSEESRLLSYISMEPQHVDDISRASGLDVAAVSSALVLMELKGLVRNLGGMKYSVVREGHAAYLTRPRIE